jgi:NADH-quinone oxidoreductase subunit A
MFASAQQAEYLGVLIYAVMAIGMGVVIIVLNRTITWLLGTAKKKQGKYETYECGVPMLGSSRERFSVKFYLVALLFVLFDIETVFLLPYAVSYKKLGMEGFLGVLAFVAVLGLGLLYILRRRVLEWD